MGMIFTVIFLALAYLSPVELFPALAPYRLQIWVAVIAFIAGIPTMLHNPYNLRLPQVYLLIGLIGAVALSRLAQHFVGASISAVLEFSTAAFAFYFVIFNACTTKVLRLISGAMLAISLFLTFQGAYHYFTSPVETPFVLFDHRLNAAGDYDVIRRIRGAGFLADPNDLAQFLLVSISFLGLAWSKRGALAKVLLVLLPGSMLLAGIALTHSRGGLLGLLFLIGLVFNSRLGRVKSMVFTCVIGAFLLALNFTGSRAISMEAGSDRLDTWREGWGMFRSSPIWGIGYGWYTNNYQYTAHNSFVLCFSELGLIGYFFWIGLIVFSLFQVRAILQLEPKTPTQMDVQRWARVVRGALYAFLVTGWFLSRTYNITFYLLIGMVAALTAIMYSETQSAELLPKWKWTMWTAIAELGSILLIYSTLKARALV